MARCCPISNANVVGVKLASAARRGRSRLLIYARARPSSSVEHGEVRPTMAMAIHSICATHLHLRRGVTSQPPGKSHFQHGVARLNGVAVRILLAPLRSQKCRTMLKELHAVLGGVLQCRGALLADFRAGGLRASGRYCLLSCSTSYRCGSKHYRPPAL